MTNDTDRPDGAPSVEGMSLILIWPLSLDIPPDQLDPDPKKDAARALRRSTIDALKKKGAWKAVDDPLRHLDEGGETSPFAYQEFVYFHRYVQRFLYGFDRKEGDLEPMEILRRDDIKAVDVDFGDLHVTLDVLRLRLHLFEAGAAVLITEVGFDESKRPDVSFSDVLTIVNRFRRVYVPFSDDKGEPQEIPRRVRWLDENACEVAGGPVETEAEMLAWTPDRSRGGSVRSPRNLASAPVAPWWRDLLDGMVIEPSKPPSKDTPCWRHISDDRMGTMLWLMLDDPTQLGPAQWQRLAYADGTDKGFAYGRDFWRGQEKNFFYDRFWDPERGLDRLTTRYAISGYHFAMVGKGKAGEWSFFGNILREHFRRHYTQIGLIVQFQFAALLATSNAISHAVARYARHGRETDFKNAIKALRQRHLNFTHRYWFTGVTNQIQGRELYDRWQKRLASKQMFKEVDEELASATGFLDARAQDRAAEAGTRLNVIAAVGLILSIALGALGANVLIENWRKADPETVAGALGPARDWGIAFLAFAASIGLGGLFLKWVLSEKREGKDLLDKVATALTWTGLALLTAGVFALTLRWASP